MKEANTPSQFTSHSARKLNGNVRRDRARSAGSASRRVPRRLLAGASRCPSAASGAASQQVTRRVRSGTHSTLSVGVQETPPTPIRADLEFPRFSPPTGLVQIELLDKPLRRAVGAGDSAWWAEAASCPAPISRPRFGHRVALPAMRIERYMHRGTESLGNPPQHGKRMALV